MHSYPKAVCWPRFNSNNKHIGPLQYEASEPMQFGVVNAGPTASYPPLMNKAVADMVMATLAYFALLLRAGKWKQSSVVVVTLPSQRWKEISTCLLIRTSKRQELPRLPSRPTRVRRRPITLIQS